VTTALGRDPLAAPRPKLWRVSDRSTFVALRRSDHRVRRGALSVTWLPDDRPTPPRVALAVGRGAGGAVVRNRVRRRLRAALRELLVAGRLPAGAYLVGAGRTVADHPWPALVAQLDDAVAAATRSSR